MAEEISLRPISVATVGIHERERLEHLVGRPGLDPGTLGLKETLHRLL